MLNFVSRAGGTLQWKGLLLLTPLCSSFLAAAVLVSMQGTQWCLPPREFHWYPRVCQHPSWISREFNAIPSGIVFRKFHQQFPRKFSANFTVGFPASSTDAATGFPATLLAWMFQQHPRSSLLECFVGTPVGNFLFASLSLWHLHLPLNHPEGYSQHHSSSEI